MASQFDDLPARVRAAAEYRLEEAGCFVRYLDHPHEWAARMRRAGRTANPQYRSWNLDQKNTRVALIFEAGLPGEPDTILGSICWRVFETEDYIDDLESGTLWYDEPHKRGWQTLRTGLSGVVSISGRICSRGGINSFRKGSAVSWWLAMFPMLASIEEGCAYNVGIPLEAIAQGGLPGRFYGYAHQIETRPVRLPVYMATAAPIYVAWSNRVEVRKILLDRLDILQSSRDKDLGAIARSHEGHHQPKPAAVG